MRCSSAGETISLSRRRRRRLRLLPFKQCCPPIFGRRTRPEPVTLKRFAAARFVFIFGMGSLAPFGEVPARRSHLWRVPGGPGAADELRGQVLEGRRFMKEGPPGVKAGGPRESERFLPLAKC